MTIAIAQMEIFPADLRRNQQSMQTLIDIAKQNQAELLVFPELAISGLLLDDHWQNPQFIADCQSIGEQIASYATDLTIIFGNIAYENGQLYNTCFMAKDGLLGRLEAPLGDAYIEGAYKPFAAHNETKPYMLDVEGKLYRTGFLLGNWREKDLPFTAKDIDLLINVSACPFLAEGLPDAPYIEGRPYFQVAGVGLQSRGKANYLFLGGSYQLDRQGKMINREADFIESVGLWQINKPGRIIPQSQPEQLLGEALIKGVQAFCHSIGQKKAVIGLSGGIDSTLAAMVYSRALGSENVLGMIMPSKYNSSLTQDLAARLAEALSINKLDMPIQVSMDSLLASFAWSTVYAPDGRQFKLEQNMTVLENMQARERTRLLAAAAASWDAIFTCNGNKAEVSVGYATFYGDLGGAFAAQADLWKHQVYQAAAYLNQKYFPQAPIAEIAAIRPSAELSPQQDVSKGLGDPLIYAYHDYLLKAMTENKQNPYDLLKLYLAGELAEYLGVSEQIIEELFSDCGQFIQDLEYWWLLYRGMAVAKRMQAPPLLAISAKPFGGGEQEIQLTPYFSDAYLQLKKEALDG